MFLYEEILNMFDQLHEGSEDPQIQPQIRKSWDSMENANKKRM